MFDSLLNLLDKQLIEINECLLNTVENLLFNFDVHPNG